MRKRLKEKPNPDVYAFRRECLSQVERLAEQGKVDLYYGDESRISLEPCVPYAWQFADEQVAMPCAKGEGVNCFALLRRDNHCLYRTTRETITAGFIVQELDRLSLCLERLTVIVVDNAAIHRAQQVKRRFALWQERGLFLVYLPAYSPHLNIVETLWRHLKYAWLQPQDYADKETLFYQVWQALSAVGRSLMIGFSPFNHCKP